MARKIFDILPPEKLKKPTKEIILPEEKKRKLSVRKTPIFFFVPLLILIAIISYFKLPKAEIVIWPE